MPSQLQTNSIKTMKTILANDEMLKENFYQPLIQELCTIVIKQESSQFSVLGTSIIR